MQSIIQDLFNGLITPYEDTAPRSPAYREAVADSSRAEDEFCRRLTSDQLLLYREAQRKSRTVTAMEAEQIFADGFRLGSRLMLEILARELPAGIG